jgi:hypothetical protein
LITMPPASLLRVSFFPAARPHVFDFFADAIRHYFSSAFFHFHYWFRHCQLSRQSRQAQLTLMSAAAIALLASTMRRFLTLLSSAFAADYWWPAFHWHWLYRH